VLYKAVTSHFMVGVAGFEPTASSSRTNVPGRLLIQAVLAVRENARSGRWLCWLMEAVVEIIADALRTEAAAPGPVDTCRTSGSGFGGLLDGAADGGGFVFGAAVVGLAASADERPAQP
jgi:hypothetical protein